jgi:hypothetical protein
MADAFAQLLREKDCEEGKVADYLVREEEREHQFQEVRVAVIGNVDAGKSTLLGTEADSKSTIWWCHIERACAGLIGTDSRGHTKALSTGPALTMSVGIGIDNDHGALPLKQGTEHWPSTSGVLTHGELDNGRGHARQKLFTHKHEV